jgi:hypothetical protein
MESLWRAWLLSGCGGPGRKSETNHKPASSLPDSMRLVTCCRLSSLSHIAAAKFIIGFVVRGRAGPVCQRPGMPVNDKVTAQSTAQHCQCNGTRCKTFSRLHWRCGWCGFARLPRKSSTPRRRRRSSLANRTLPRSVRDRRRGCEKSAAGRICKSPAVQ